MAKVFVSYSRKDIEFAKRLTNELKKSDLDFWIDWEGIPPTVDWWREIEKGIEESDVFLFLISPDSAKSKVCGQEIDVAVQNGKRIIPIVVREIEWEDTPPQLGHLNYIFFSRDDDFNTAVKKLMTAIQTDYEWAATQRRLQVKALEWERNHKENSFLLRGLDLLDAEQDLATNTSKDPHPTDLQREYVFESRKATDQQRRITTGVSIAVAIALAALAIFGFYQADKATKQATISRAGELAAQAVSQREKQFDLSLLLSVEAFRVADTIQTKSALLDNTQANPELLQNLNISTGGIFDLNFDSIQNSLILISCTEEMVASSCPSIEIITWNMNTSQAVTQPLTEFGGEITSAAIHPDGRTIAVALSDNSIIIWDLLKHQTVGQPLKAPGEYIYTLSFNSDGRFLASASGTLLESGSENIILWNIESEQSINQPIEVDFIPDSIAFNPDGKTLAIGGLDVIVLWDIEAWEPAGQQRIEEIKDDIRDLAFSPDGRLLAAAGYNIHLWDISNGQIIDQFHENSGSYHQYTSLSFSQDGKTLVSGECQLEDVVCIRGKISLWDLTGIQTIKHPINGINTTGSSIAFNPNGKTAALSTDDGSVILWDIENHQILGKPFRFPEESIYNAAFSPDGDTLIAAGDHIYFWNIDSEQIIGKPIKNLGGNIALSPDGKTLAMESINTIFLWNIGTGQSIGQPINMTENYPIAFAFNPDGKKLVIGSSGNKDIIFWDVTTGQLIKPQLEEPGGYVISLAFSPDGKTFVSAGEGVIFWDLANGQPIGQPLEVQTGDIFSVAFSPDGKLLASGGCMGASIGFCVQGQIVLWDVESQKPIGNPIIVDGDAIYKVVFGSDGIMGTASSSSVILWEMSPSAWAKSNCWRAGRNLTRDEWVQYGFTEPHRKTCEQWP
jgi:WD40 repeat protein